MTIQFKITFTDPGTGAPRPDPVCQSTTSNSLGIDIDRYGNASYSVNDVLQPIEHIEVYASGPETRHDFHVLVNDPRGYHIQTLTHLSEPISTNGSCAWSLDATGALDIHFTSPAQNDGKQAWAFGTQTPGLVLTVKVKKQQAPNSTDCKTWDPISFQAPFTAPPRE